MPVVASTDTQRRAMIERSKTRQRPRFATAGGMRDRRSPAPAGDGCSPPARPWREEDPGLHQIGTATVRPLDVATLSARREVIQFKRRRNRLLERLGKPAYINTDASCREGLAGLAYASHALGTRTELVLCDDITKAEHMALLMAMEDAERVLAGRIEFRVDSTAVVTYATGKSPALEAVRRRIDILMARHP
jgi:hypothetical protein